MTSPALIGVLDIADGRCVHAVAGDRRTYQPLSKSVGGSDDPSEAALTLRDHGAEGLYIADLDGLAGRPPHPDALPAFAPFADRGPNLLDAGWPPTVHFPEVTTVLGSELLGSADDLAGALPGIDTGEQRPAFSLDLRNGRPLGGWSLSPLAIADAALATGQFGTLIVLDVASVGTGQVATLELCSELRRRHPDITLISGGGVSSRRDLDAFGVAGCDAVLVGTALHRGPLA